MFMNEQDALIKEVLDISDPFTRKKIISLEEAEQTQVLSALTNALYDKIVQKVDNIDFGTIPMSRGDITKVDGFNNTMECLDIMRRLVLEYHQDPACIDTVITAVNNIKERKAIWVKAYALNVEFPMMMYNLVVLAIEQCVSFLIAVCIQYVKDPTTNDMNIALDKVSYASVKENLMYNQLISFNKCCADKSLDRAMDEIMKNGGKVKEDGSMEWSDDPHAAIEDTPYQNQEPDSSVPCPGSTNLPNNVDAINGGADGEDIEDYPEPVQEDLLMGLSAVGVAVPVIIGAGTAIVLSFKVISFLLKSAIPMMRSIVYYFYNTSTKIAGFMYIQSKFIEANAYKLQNSVTDMDDNKKAKVVAKQMKIADMLKKAANKMAIENKKATKETKQMENEDTKKFKLIEKSSKRSMQSSSPTTELF